MSDPQDPDHTDDGDIGPFPSLDRKDAGRAADVDLRWSEHKSQPLASPPQSLFEALDNPKPPPATEPLQPDPPSNWLAGADPHDLVEPVPAVEAARHPLHKLGRFAFPPTPPLDDAAAAARDQRWTGQVVLVATLFLAVFNGASVSDWVRQQPPGWTTATVRGLSDTWNTQMSLLGADQPRQGIRELWDQARSARFIWQAADNGQGPSGVLDASPPQRD